MKSVFALLAASLALAAHGPNWAQSGRSLSEARSAVINGTTPGIALIPASPKPAAQAPNAPASAPAGSKVEAVPVPVKGATATAAVAAAPTAAATAAATKTPANSSPTPAAAAVAATPSVIDRIGNFLRGNEPLSGESLNAAKQHTSPNSGIVLPTAASRSASAAATKP